MINKERLISSFLEMVRIPSESGNEKEIAQYLISRLSALGLEVIIDHKSAEAAGMETGNLIARLPGNRPDIPPLLFCAHMDTVKPGVGIKPVLKDGVIYSQGDTILGSDDKAGVSIAVELIEHLIEEKLPHGELEFVFTFCEEIGLYGSKNLSSELVHAKQGYVLDGGGNPGTICNNGPVQDSFKAVIFGKSAHAGQRPEEGISAIQVAARAIDNMLLLRIDYETTANIGSIAGGLSTNIVCEKIEIKGEVRSLSHTKLEKHMAQIKEALEDACKDFGARLELDILRMYPSYKVEEDHPLIKLAKSAAVKAGLEPKIISMTGGTDGNFLNSMGITAVSLCLGPTKAHTTDEYIKTEDLYDAVRFTTEIVSQTV